MKTISCFFFIVLIFVLWPRRTVSAGGDLIDKACEKTPYKELCKSSLRGEDESPGADLNNLARIAVNVAWTNATDTQEYMNTLLNTMTEPFMQQSLQDCDATYDDAIGNLEGSDSAFESKGYDDIMSWLGAAMIDPQTCEDYFKELPGHSSPLTSRNEMLIQLCSNALALTKLVANGDGKDL